jgi:hypothetical protein
VLNLTADALLAFQFQERDEDDRPSDRARLGAFFMAEYYLMHKAFMRGFSSKGGE